MVVIAFLLAILDAQLIARFVATVRPEVKRATVRSSGYKPNISLPSEAVTLIPIFDIRTGGCAGRVDLIFPRRFRLTNAVAIKSFGSAFEKERVDGNPHIFFASRYLKNKRQNWLSCPVCFP